MGKPQQHPVAGAASHNRTSSSRPPRRDCPARPAAAAGVPARPAALAVGVPTWPARSDRASQRGRRPPRRRASNSPSPARRRAGLRRAAREILAADGEATAAGAAAGGPPARGRRGNCLAPARWSSIWREPGAASNPSCTHTGSPPPSSPSSGCYSGHEVGARSLEHERRS